MTCGGLGCLSYSHAVPRAVDEVLVLTKMCRLLPYDLGPPLGPPCEPERSDRLICGVLTAHVSFYRQYHKVILSLETWK